MLAWVVTMTIFGGNNSPFSEISRLGPGEFFSREHSIIPGYPMNLYKVRVVRPLIWRYGQENTNLKVKQMDSLHVINRHKLDEKCYNCILRCQRANNSAKPFQKERGKWQPIYGISHLSEKITMSLIKLIYCDAIRTESDRMTWHIYQSVGEE